MTRSHSTRSEKKGGQKTSKEKTRPESPEFFGFSNCDIPQPILIKTEPVEDGDCNRLSNGSVYKPLYTTCTPPKELLQTVQAAYKPSYKPRT